MRLRTLVPVSLAVVALVLVSLSLFIDSANSAVATPAPLNVTVSLSAPGNGSFLAAGEQAQVTVTLKDKSGNPLSKDDFATLNLYMYGPQETTKTISAVKLLNATTDRSKTPHHFIDLLTNPNVQVQGNVLRYNLQPVSDEEAGTYTATAWAVQKGATPANQIMALADFQLGTATVEDQIVEREKCAACHQGAANGQFYLHHVDGSATRPYGNPSLDNAPVRSCKSCHNNEGYAAFTLTDGTRVPDQIVRRVHGVHMGEHLKNPVNTDPNTGVFKNYLGVIFPANVKDCAKCHVDDRWKTAPSALACGACHDTVNFETGANHPGGPQADNTSCAVCHPADSGGLAPISAVHKVVQRLNQVDLSITPPANGKFYVAGEAPVATIVIRDDSGNPIDHTQVTNANFGTAGLFVYGPRRNSVPALTSTAKFGSGKLRASVTNTKVAPAGGWVFPAGANLKVAVNNGDPIVIPFSAGAMTPAQVRDLLASRLSGVTVTNTATQVTIRSNIQGGDPSGSQSNVAIYNSPVNDVMLWKPVGVKFSRGVTAGMTQEPFVVSARASFPNNDMRALTDPLDFADPMVSRGVDSIIYQLDDVAGIEPGTYAAYVWVTPSAATRIPNFKLTGIAFTTFQIGTATEDKKVADNCKDCHGNTIWHLDEGPIHPEPFDTDYCRACHDYSRQHTGESFPNIGGTTTNGWAGFGAKPISARVHGVHRGLYLDHPEQVYGGNPDAFSEVIFPQDIRNCQKCHEGPNITKTWIEEPNRLACTGCHDSDVANAHTKINTFMENPDDPYSAENTETCTVCHGAGRDFAADKMHNISNPYQPPYAREPER